MSFLKLKFPKCNIHNYIAYMMIQHVFLSQLFLLACFNCQFYFKTWTRKPEPTCCHDEIILPPLTHAHKHTHTHAHIHTHTHTVSEQQIILYLHFTLAKLEGRITKQQAEKEHLLKIPND